MLTGEGRQMTSEKQSYNKSFLDTDAQITLLKSRGMVFYDENQAKESLLNLNYYRLSGYWLPFKNRDDTFVDNTYFEEIINTYTFDSQLRKMLFRALETIEISAKTKLAYYLSRDCGAHPLISSNFSDEHKFNETYNKLNKEINRQNQHLFIEHYKNNYTQSLPPIWVCVEVMTFGMLSQFTKNIKSIDIKKAIAKCYNLDISLYESILYHLSMLRNEIAHHSRIYNKTAKIIPKIPSILKQNINHKAVGYIYNTLVLIDYLLGQIDSKNNFMSEINSLIDTHNIDKTKMGFK